jgi:hypothetical protein
MKFWRGKGEEEGKEESFLRDGKRKRVRYCIKCGKGGCDVESCVLEKKIGNQLEKGIRENPRKLVIVT